MARPPLNLFGAPGHFFTDGLRFVWGAGVEVLLIYASATSEDWMGFVVSGMGFVPGLDALSLMFRAAFVHSQH